MKLGTVREFGGTPSVPPTEAFNIGGAKSLRGYSELSIGPLNDRNVAGNVLIESNLELRFPVWNSFGGVLFLDAANVLEELHFDERLPPADHRWHGSQVSDADRTNQGGRSFQAEQFPRLACSTGRGANRGRA